MKNEIFNNDISECILNIEGSVLKQNKTCQSICGNMISQQCYKGCQQHLKNINIKRHELNLLRSRMINKQYYDITRYLSDNFVYINLYPTRNIHFNFSNFNLTNRELEIVNLMFEGYRNLEIIKILGISKSTLKTHINHVYQKIGDKFKVLRP